MPMILNYSSQSLSIPSKPVSLIQSSASPHSTLGSPTTVSCSTVISLKQVLSAPGRNFELILPLLVSALQAPQYHFPTVLKPLESPSIVTSLLIAISQQSVSLLSTTPELYDISENPSLMTWLRLWQLHSFSLASTTPTLSSMASPNPTSISYSEFTIPCLALFSTDTHSHLQNGLLSELHWSPIHQRINFKLATSTFKALYLQQPPHLASLLHPYHSGSIHTLRSSHDRLLALLRCRTEFGKRAFSSAAPSVWNSIPIEIRSSRSLPSFKRRLKSYFFTQPSLV